MPLANPKRLRSIYTLLRSLPPFERWNLPDPAAVRFELLHDRDHAEYTTDDRDRCYIAVNPDTHLTIAQLIESVAHEMCHMRQDLLGRLPAKAENAHNAEFRRLARLVCGKLGFDVQRF